MKFSRWPAVVILGGLVVAAYVIDQDHVRPEPEHAGAETPLDAQGFLPVAAPDDALTSTWYCPGGTVSEDGFADTTIVVANAGEQELSGQMTVFPSLGERQTIDLQVAAYDRTEVHLADQITVGEPDPPEGREDNPAATNVFAGALVELGGGSVVVEQQVEGPEGADVSPCATQAADQWYFADGRTTADATELLVFFNPFPDPAVIDVTFRTERDLRTPTEFEGYVVPARSVVVENLDDYVSRRVHVAATVVARTGRLVVNRLLQLDGSEGPRGLEVATGASRAAEHWLFPDGVVAEGIDESFVVYNPSDTPAEVDLTIEADDVARLGEIEPFSLTIPAEGYQEVVISDEERVATALADAGGERILRHGANVVSLNGVPVVAERLIAGTEDTDRVGFDGVLGQPLLTDRAVVAASSVSGESIIVQNPSGSQPARVTIRSLDGGSLGESADATDVEVPPAGRVVLPVAELGLGTDRPLVVESDLPVAIERRMALGDPLDVSGAVAVPLAGSVTEPPSLFETG
jgi:Family of unknown function (DUF5719)